MANFNKVMLIGNLTRDPEIRYLQSGTPVCEVGLAVNRSWRDQNTNETREETTYVDCKAWGRQAEVLNQYMEKGRPLFVEGRLNYRSWEAKDGSRRSKLEVVIENFQFLGGRREEGGGGPPRRGGEAGFGGPGGGGGHGGGGPAGPGGGGYGGGGGGGYGDPGGEDVSGGGGFGGPPPGGGFGGPPEDEGRRGPAEEPDDGDTPF